MARPKRKTRRWLWLGILVLGILALAGGGYYSQIVVPQTAAQAAAVKTLKTAKAQKGDITISAEGTATVVAVSQAVLGFQSGGQIAELRAQAGDAVQAGQVLAKLDTTDLELQLAQAEANLALAQSKWHQTQTGGTPSEVAAAQAALKAANASYDNLLHPDLNTLIMAKSDLDTAQAALSQAQAAYDKIGGAANPEIAMMPQALQLQTASLAYQKALAVYNSKVSPTDAQVQAAQAQIQQAQNALAQLSPTDDDLAQAQANVDAARAARDLAKRRLTEATLVAPFDGTVAEVTAAVGQVVGTAPILTLVDVSKPWVQVALDDTDASKAALGYPVEVTLDAVPNQTFQGKIVEVDPTVILVNGVSTLYATAELTNPAPFLKVGMGGNAKITAASAKQVLTVPVEAVREISAGHYAVFVVDDKQQLTLRPVEIGLQGTSFVEIKSGLQLGETVSTGTVETQ